jgi:hypothetical protein
VGGLPGMMLSLSDAWNSPDVKQFALVGPVGTCRFVAGMRNFMFRYEICLLTLNVDVGSALPTTTT